MKDLICLECPESRFLDPSTEICWKTGGLWCGKLERIVGKFDPCHIPPAEKTKGAKGRKGRTGKKR